MFNHSSLYSGGELILLSLRASVTYTWMFPHLKKLNWDFFFLYIMRWKSAPILRITHINSAKRLFLDDNRWNDHRNSRLLHNVPKMRGTVDTAHSDPLLCAGGNFMLDFMLAPHNTPHLETIWSHSRFFKKVCASVNFLKMLMPQLCSLKMVVLPLYCLEVLVPQ